MEPASIESAPSVFCLPGNELLEVLVKESVPEMVVAAGLKGFEFRTPGKSHLKALFEGEATNHYPGALP
jgi:hypothetical protein